MSTAPRRYTAAEYLEMERAAETKHEFVNGYIYAMSGGSFAHSRIAINVAAALHTAFRGRDCDVYNGDLRVKVSETGLYTYPDVSALCGRSELEDDRSDTLLNPSLVVEVLSPSTESYDRTEKFEHYRRVASLREYVLIAQDRPYVERHVRDGDGWVLTEFNRLDQAVELPSVRAALSLRDTYYRVAFPEYPRPRVVREPAPAYAGASE